MKRGRQGEGGGKKRKYQSVKALDDKILEYFQVVREQTDPTYQIPTISGLALHLGFLSSKALYDYEQTPKYGESIKKARLLIEKAIEHRLVGGKPPIGLIFALKNRFGWRDTQAMDITSNGETLGVVQLPQR